MFTKNFYNVLTTTLYAVVLPYTLTNGTTEETYNSSRSSKSGSTNYTNYWNAFMYKWASTINTEGVFFGTGTTAPTKDDYKPESILDTNSISVANPSRIIVNQTDDYVEAIVSFTITNKSTSAITISEIGCLGYVGSSLGSSYVSADSDHPPYLAERQLLETPITLEAGEAESIQYRVRFPYGA